MATATLRIGVTGSEGLLGEALCAALLRAGHAVRGLDLRAPEGSERHGDIRDLEHLSRWVEGCDGVVHLAAVSRVVDAERDPERCESTNVTGTANVVSAAERAGSWLLFASSREVYGEPARLPVYEDDPVAPLNRYGRSKAEGERIVAAARARGAHAAVLRFANVYGSTRDHPDRVVPAFCRNAAKGNPLRVDGALHTFDFTHLDDTVGCIVKVVDALASGARDLPTTHVASGRPTTLGQLAVMASAAGGWRSEIVEAPSRDFDVSRFCGDPSRAFEVLGWRSERAVEDGVAELVRAFSRGQ